MEMQNIKNVKILTLKLVHWPARRPASKSRASSGLEKWPRAVGLLGSGLARFHH